MEPLREIRNRLLNGWQLSKLHTFEVAARHQSFALAAEELSLSPSAVSHRINQLEEELGIQLFVRSHRKVELTHEGKRVYWALKSSLDTLNQEILDIKNQELSGPLTLYSRPSIAQCWLVPALGDFTRRYPSISLTVLTGNDNVNLQRAGIDLAIYFDDAPSAQLAHHFLMDEEILPVCSPEYAHRHDLTNTVINLRHCTLLHDRQAKALDDKALAALITAALQGEDASAYAAEVASVTDALKSELASELKAGLELRLSKKVHTGFRLCAKDGSGYIDCSDEELAEQLAPFFRELRI